MGLLKKKIPKQFLNSHGELIRKPPRRLTYNKQTARLEGMKLVARLNAEDKWKKTKRGFRKSIRDHIGKAIDRLDPLKVAAILGCTIAVKQVIDASEDLAVHARAKGAGLKQTGYFGAFLGLPWLNPLILMALPIQEEETAEVKKLREEFASPSAEMMEWLTSFFIAYIIVEHGGQIIGLLEKGLGTVVPMLLGV